MTFSDGAPNSKRHKVEYSDFKESDWLDRIMARKREKTKFFGKACISKLYESSVRTHTQILSFLLSPQPLDARNRVFRAFVMTCYMQHVSENGNFTAYRVPIIVHGLCRDLRVLLMNISKETYVNWKNITVPRQDVLTSDHGLTAYTSDAAKPIAHNAIRQFVSDIAASDGHSLPFHIRRSDVNVQKTSICWRYCRATSTIHKTISTQTASRF